MPIYVAVAGAGETPPQIEDWIKLTPEIRIYWLDGESGLWLAAFPDNGPDPGPRFRSLNAEDWSRLSSGSAATVERMEWALKDPTS